MNKNETEWFSSLQKLGFSNDQIVNMWKERESTKRSGKNNQEFGNTKKRKIETLLEKKQKFSDEVITLILRFCNDNFDGFKLMIVNRQFMKQVFNLKMLIIRNDDEKMRLILKQFVGSQLCQSIERLIILKSLEDNLLRELVTKCVNIKFLTAPIPTQLLELSFTNPSLKEIKFFPIDNPPSIPIDAYPPLPSTTQSIVPDLAQFHHSSLYESSPEERSFRINNFLSANILKDCNLATDALGKEIFDLITSSPRTGTERVLIHQEFDVNSIVVKQIFFEMNLADGRWKKVTIPPLKVE